VLSNRFLQPEIDPETLSVVPSIGQPSPAEARLPCTWISILRRQVGCSLAGTSGVEEPADVAKYLLAGADAVMTASALIRHGPGHAAVLLDGLSGWMARKGYNSVSELRGLLALPPTPSRPEPSAHSISARCTTPAQPSFLSDRCFAVLPAARAALGAAAESPARSPRSPAAEIGQSSDPPSVHFTGTGVPYLSSAGVLPVL
jgi:hypothetical protein